MLRTKSDRESAKSNLSTFKGPGAIFREIIAGMEGI